MYRQIPEARLQILKEVKEGKTHKEILIHIAKLFNYKSYLEIGTQNPNNCFDHIPCEINISVDTDLSSKADYVMTSREFWKGIDLEIETEHCPDKFDLIFIDGEHTHKENKNDLKEALKNLSPKGTIVMHDAKPWNEESQRVPRETRQWNGDVWKTIVDHVALANHLVYTIDIDFGICCIHPFAPREQESRGITTFYEVFKNDQEKFLNLISIEEWYKKIKDIEKKSR